MKSVAMLPTLLTLGNTFCGFLAIAKVGDALMLEAADTEVFRSRMMAAAGLILLAMVFDALDGRIARLTRHSTDFGAQLDSLTDLITFGVAPAFLAKVLCEHSFLAVGHTYRPKFILMLAVLFVVCAALRLARFTLETVPDEEAHKRFKGLPSPAAAGVVASSVIFYFNVIVPRTSSDFALAFTRVLPFTLPVLGLLMVSRIPYVHVVGRFLGGRQPFVYVVQVVFLALLILVFHEWMPLLEILLLAAFVGYTLSGCVAFAIRRLVHRHAESPRAGTK
ncbi:MAG: CDP-alcohol phosphatidyltransferase family protein [Planctomycetota bacterium]